MLGVSLSTALGVPLSAPAGPASSYVPEASGATFAWDGRYMAPADTVSGTSVDSLSVLRSYFHGTTQFAAAETGGERADIDPTGVNGLPAAVFDGGQYYHGSAAMRAAASDGPDLTDFAFMAVVGAVTAATMGTMLSMALESSATDYYYVNDGSIANTALRRQIRSATSSVQNNNFPGVQYTGSATTLWGISQMGVGCTLGNGTSSAFFSNTDTPLAPTLFGVGIGGQLAQSSVLATEGHWSGKLAFLAYWFGGLPTVGTMTTMAQWTNSIWGSPL